MEKQKRRVFAREFKLEAVRLVKETGRPVAQIARELGVGETVLNRWVQQFESDPEQSFPGQGRLKARDAEVEALRRENEILRQERDILKKAISIFSGGRK